MKSFNLRVDVNARLSILKSTTDDLKTSLDAAWVEIETLKQQDEQSGLQLAEFAKDNAQLQAEMSAIKARVIKLDNLYQRRKHTASQCPRKPRRKLQGNFTRVDGRGQNGGCEQS